MAAAPELLEALEGMLSDYESRHGKNTANATQMLFVLRVEQEKL
jgi:hypothetical protein